MTTYEIDLDAVHETMLRQSIDTGVDEDEEVTKEQLEDALKAMAENQIYNLYQQTKN